LPAVVAVRRSKSSGTALSNNKQLPDTVTIVVDLYITALNDEALRAFR